MKEKKKLVILTGPTAVGKTETSIRLAKLIGGEIISADSAQVYRGMDIGSAKITTEEMDGVTHYLIDICDPSDEFNIVIFQTMAKRAMAEIYERGHIPIIVGGTGFYIQSIIYDIDFSECDENTELRDRLTNLAKTQGNHVVHEMLRKVDPESANAIHENNLKRVIRAIEFYEQTGEKISSHNEQEREKQSPYDFYYFVLNCNRELLYERIEKRVDLMLECGLVDEVKHLLKKGYDRNLTSMQALGYKEMIAYLKGEYSLQDAISIIKRDTRHFAKRQLTWFRREKDVIWVEKEKFHFDTEEISRTLAQMVLKGSHELPNKENTDCM